MITEPTYHEVFVVHGVTFGDLFVVWGMLGVAIVFAVPLLHSRMRVTLKGGSITAARIAVCMFPALAVAVALGTVRDFSAAQAQYRRGDYSVVEGTVSDFTPGSALEHRDEAFRVGQQVFRYSSSTISPYFHRTVEKGGLILSGLRVRISHVNGNILRLEVAS